MLHITKCFSRFGSDLDKSTQKILNHGAILLEVLKQKQYMPLKMSQEIIDIYAVQSGLLDDVNANSVHHILKLLDNAIRTHHNYIYEHIENDKKFTDEDKNEINELINTIKKNIDEEDLTKYGG